MLIVCLIGIGILKMLVSCICKEILEINLVVIKLVKEIKEVVFEGYDVVILIVRLFFLNVDYILVNLFLMEEDI